MRYSHAMLRAGLAGLTLAGLFPQAAIAGEQPDAADKTQPIRDQVIQFQDIPALIKNPTFITMHLEKADVRAVLETISRQAGMNLILDDSVQGQFSIDVRAIPLDQFFGLVLRENGLAARRVGNSLLIGTEDALAKKIDDQQAASFRLNNADAAATIPLLQKMITAKDINMVADPRTNSILATGSGEDLAKIKNAIAALDQPTPQVVIEVKLVEVTRDDENRLGGEFGFGGSKFGVSNNVSTPGGAGIPSSGDSATSITFSAMGNVTSNLNARIDALVQNNEAHILADPRVATQDSHTASINIVDKVPVVQVNFSGSGANTIAAENVTFQPIGEQLQITPHVSADGYVTMDIQPTISERGKDVIVNKNPVPEITERTLQTRMRVHDGESVVIGGLIRRTHNKSVSKMPILGDLPLIGWLFRQETGSGAEDEIIVIVTPHITTEKSTEY
ncbi:MAG TPA: secretin N-terminal domain-containing protein [Oscillatoriaceae cyanobacterium]